MVKQAKQVKQASQPRSKSVPSIEAERTDAAGALISDKEIYERIIAAVMEHRLPPGMKLGEEKLGKIFGVSRTLVRQALSRLATERVVVLQPNRGAFVAEPTVEEAREIFELRRLLEALVVRRVIRLATPEMIERLWAHVRAEEKARAQLDRRAIIRLSGEYHVLLADLSGSTLVARLMRELASLTCLIIILYDAPAVPACRDQEHFEITQAIAAGDEAAAIRLMDEHLAHVEACLDLSRGMYEDLELEAALAG